MFGETSEFGPIDVLGQLGVNALGSHMACKNDSLRVGIKNKSGEIPAYGDFRFLGGVLSAVVGQWTGNANVRRGAHDLAAGLLGSYVATETARRAAIARLEAGDASLAPGVQQITQAPPTSSQPEPQKVPAEGNEPKGNPNYGW